MCANSYKSDYVAYYAISQSLKLKNKNYFLHRFLIQAPKGKLVDHIDGNTLNNKKSNLRICSYKENAKNRILNKNNKSGHKGVYWDIHITTPKWKAYIYVDKKCYHLGYFNTYEEAVKCREKAEKKYFREYNRD